MRLILGEVSAEELVQQIGVGACHFLSVFSSPGLRLVVVVVLAPLSAAGVAWGLRERKREVAT